MTRGEDVILSEINYERTRMNQSILSILSYIANQHPLIMILNYAHYAQKSTLDLLQALIESKPIKNLGIIISYNEVIPVISYARDSWDALIKHAEKKRHIITGELRNVNSLFLLRFVFLHALPFFKAIFRFFITWYIPLPLKRQITT